MRAKVLYFPYIDVPQSTWLTRMLLYWDSVGVIMPYQFVENPEELKTFTRDLLQAGLLTQVIPGHYLGDIPRFSKAFLAYLNSLGNEIERRRKRFLDQQPARRKHRLRDIHFEKLGTVPIHIEKTDSLAEELVDLRLATLINPPWLSLEAKTAEEFMYYLATVLGKHRELQFTPVTDEQKKLAKLTSFIAPENLLEKSLDALRLDVLEDVLPAPSRPVPVIEIERFKGKYGDQLSRFRRKIEMELMRLVDINSSELRKRSLQLFKEDLAEEIEDLESKMKESRWPSIICGKLCALLSPVPVIGRVTSIVNAAYTAFGEGGPSKIDSPLAYAAYARRRILH